MESTAAQPHISTTWASYTDGASGNDAVSDYTDGLPHGLLESFIISGCCTLCSLMASYLALTDPDLGHLRVAFCLRRIFPASSCDTGWLPDCVVDP